MARRQWLVRVVFGVVMVVVAVAVAGAQTAQPLTPKEIVGVWEGAAQTPNGDVTLKVEFTIKEEKLAGMIESSMGPMPVTTVTLTEDGISMEIVVMESPAFLVAKVTGTRMDGTWTLGEQSGPFTLTKSGGTAPDPKK